LEAAHPYTPTEDRPDPFFNFPAGLIPSGRTGSQGERVSQGELEERAWLESGLRVIDEQMGGDHACADRAAGNRTDRTADECTRDHAAGNDCAVFDLIAVDAGAGVDGASEPTLVRAPGVAETWARIPQRVPSGRMTVSGRRRMEP